MFMGDFKDWDFNEVKDTPSYSTLIKEQHVSGCWKTTQDTKYVL
jgi:hypothetical protein